MTIVANFYKPYAAAMKQDSKNFTYWCNRPWGNVPHFSKDVEAFLMNVGVDQERDKAEFENNIQKKAGLKATVCLLNTKRSFSVLEVEILS